VDYSVVAKPKNTELNSMKLLFATRNLHKVQEVAALFTKGDIQVVSPANLGVSADFDVEETGTTFEANAELKARGFGLAVPASAQVLTAADDSGLCVEALNGQPGVYSKRFIPGTDHDRNLHLLKLLDGQTNRRAYFITVVALWDPTQGFDADDQSVKFFEGRVEGVIGTEERGTEGFGYDPLFIPDGYTQSFGELGLEVKNTLSHRARAFAKLQEYLESKEI
jgi:XTP/dITP diphosphohydrolase